MKVPTDQRRQADEHRPPNPRLGRYSPLFRDQLLSGRLELGAARRVDGRELQIELLAVSYTHLTLPTILRV